MGELRSLVAGSRELGKGTPWSIRNLEEAEGSSSAATPSTRALRDSMYLWRRLSEGASETQGGHQLAQKSRTTILPRKSDKRRGLPETSREKSLAVVPAMEASPWR